MVYSHLFEEFELFFTSGSGKNLSTPFERQLNSSYPNSSGCCVDEQPDRRNIVANKINTLTVLFSLCIFILRINLVYLTLRYDTSGLRFIRGLCFDSGIIAF